jgi:hypothetical protein
VVVDSEEKEPQAGAEVQGRLAGFFGACNKFLNRARPYALP